MHVRLRLLGKPEAIIVVESKLTKIDQFRRLVNEKYNIEPKLQRLIYCGKELENGYNFHDYSIKVNDVIQLIIKTESIEELKKNENEKEDKGQDIKVVYKDAKSLIYAIGDLVDVRDMESGAWFEGRIIRTVLDPNEQERELTNTQTVINHENVSPNIQNGSKNDAGDKQNGLKSYFSKASNSKGRNSKDKSKEQVTESSLLYQVKMDDDDESESYYKFKDIRPRARQIIDIQDLKVGQCVMINHNTEDVTEKGYWYDFKVSEIKKLQKSHELIGTLYLGADAVPQHDTKVRLLDKIYAIETIVPVAERNDKYNKMMTTEPEKRSQPLNCLTCRDNESAPCKDCGCFKCLGKEDPDKIILCDECNNGYHMTCLPTPLTDLPSDDWYCPSCKREDHVTKQAKKIKTTTRDWGRGMACVGKTKTCSMPPNHFGPIPGIEVGMKWRFRIQLSESGVHRPPVSGIHGRDVEGAYSIVLSGGYEDDYDNGIEFTYTGSGGRDLSGNKRTADQSCDQILARENKALARNCAVKLNESGADAGDNWKEGKPVRVVRSYKMIKHFPQYAPKEGIRYDGIYKVVKYYPEKGKSGFIVWKYLLRRDDPVPAPWEKGAKQYDIVYPDGYLEAEAEKRAQKEKNKKTKRKSKVENESSDDEEEKKPTRTKKNQRKSIKDDDSEGETVKSSVKRKNSKRKVISDDSTDENEEKSDETPVKKKRKVGKSLSPAKVNGKSKNTSPTKSPLKKISEMFTPKKSTKEEPLTKEEADAIKADELNSKLWEECLEKCNTKGKKDFIEKVTEVFLCIICQDVVANPVTTPCLHNFCMGCLKLAYKSTAKQCPCCRGSLANFDLEYNEQLKEALRTVMPGYDAGKK